MDGEGGHQPGLDALRGIAVLGVMYGHAGILRDFSQGRTHGPETFVAANGWRGIYLFFALSGYLIFLPFARSLVNHTNAPATSRYVRRRFARILPAHWIALCAMAFLVAPLDFTWGRFVAHVLLVQNFVPGVSNAILPVTWTLGLEAIFYALVPIVTWVLARKFADLTLRGALTAVSAIWLTGLGILAMSGPIAELPATPISVLAVNVLTPIVGYLAFFAPGMTVAFVEAYRSSGRRISFYEVLRRHPGVCGLAAIGAWFASVELPPPLSVGGVPNHLFDGFIGLFAVIGALGMSRRAERAARHLTRLGEVSYGVYLWHWIVYFMIAIGSARLGVNRVVFSDQTLDWILAAAVTLPIAGLSWRFVEKPAIAWSRGARRGNELRLLAGRRT